MLQTRPDNVVCVLIPGIIAVMVACVLVVALWGAPGVGYGIVLASSD